jgi:hypothetical protein
VVEVRRHQAEWTPRAHPSKPGEQSQRIDATGERQAEPVVVRERVCLVVEELLDRAVETRESRLGAG